MNLRSIHFRLIAWYSALVVLVAIAFGAFTYRSLEHRLTQEIVETLSRRAQSIGDNILRNTTLEKQIARQIEAVYSPEASSRFIRVSKTDGSIIYVSGKPKDELFSPDKIPPITPGTHEIITTQVPLDSGFGLISVTVPIVANGQTWLVQMGMPSDQIDTALRELLLTLLISLPALTIVAASGGVILLKRSLKPVEDIRATAEKITFGNLSRRLPLAATGDELEHLSVTLNQMLDRLENAYLQVSRFSADASHELRTPLTIMRTELESIAQEPVFGEHLRERIGSVLEETEHLSRITESLFAISRLDAGEAKMESKSLDLAVLTASTAEQMQLLADEKQIIVDIQATAAVMVEGDPTRLKQVVVNLLDNAIKYTPHGGNIQVGVARLENKAVLGVRDNGIGIVPGVLPHVFERFYRADKARSRDAGGAGLGLSIVRSVIQAHGGTVDIQSAEGAGTTVLVELPAIPSEGA